MLHDAVYVLHWDGGAFLEQFIASGIAYGIEIGSPKYLTGRSGLELYLDVLEAITGHSPGQSLVECATVENIDCFDRTDACWVGWMLTHYQWYSCHSFREILTVTPYEELLGLYKTLHEADIRKTYEILDAHFATQQKNDISIIQ